MAQWDKGFSGLQLWLGFDPWPGNFHMLLVQPKKKKKKEKKREVGKPNLCLNTVMKVGV